VEDGEQQEQPEVPVHQDFDPTKFILVDKEVIQKIDIMKSKSPYFLIRLGAAIFTGISFRKNYKSNPSFIKGTLARIFGLWFFFHQTNTPRPPDTQIKVI
jgi:hypothetical protein